MDNMRIDYDPASNIVDETNDFILYDINSQNNIILLLKDLTFSVVVPNHEREREVHASEPTTEKQQPWEERPFKMNPQCSGYQTRLQQFLSTLAA